MKLRPLHPVIEQPTAIDGVAVIISHVGRAPSGLLRARAGVWNGRQLASDVIDLDRAAHRQRLAKAASKADPEMIPDPAPVDAALLECAEALQASINDPKHRPSERPPDGQPSANFPDLVDVVIDDDAALAFLVVDPSGQHGVSVVSVVSPAEGGDDLRPFVPPPARGLPWHLPRAAEVLRYLEPGADSGSALFDDLVTCLKLHALLPGGPGGHSDAYYVLLAAWEFHTYLLEVAAYSAMLAFTAVPERGKSRTGRTLTYIARRGIHTETLREANLFRDSQDRRATLFLDCKGLWRKAEKLGCEDILLQRFEKGARVGRVLYPERGPFHDTVYYDIFGPTILASNEPLGRILDTRCIPIAMPLAPDGVEYPVPDEAALLPLRERLTAWRARQLVAGWVPEPMAKPAPSRLGDVLLPLVQLVAQVAPRHLPSMLALARHLQAERRSDRALSWEAAIVTALTELRSQVLNGLLLINVLAEQVNTDRPEKERLSNKRISDVLRSVGLEVRKTHGNKAAVVWDDDKIATLSRHYAQSAEQGNEERTAKNPAGEGSADANHANQTNPSERERFSL
jgi:hypothetical protein